MLKLPVLTPMLNKLFSPEGKPPLSRFYPYIFVLLLAYWIVDLVLLYNRPKMIPTQAPPAKIAKRGSSFSPPSSFRDIIQRNLFSADQKIPPALSAEKDGAREEQNIDGPATLTRLPLKLTGTIVHFNAKKSIATINYNGNATDSFRIGDEIPSMAKILIIERRKVTFRNLNSQKKEYVEIPEDVKLTFDAPKAKPPPSSFNSAPKEAGGKKDFKLKRSDVDKYTSNLQGVLSQAAVAPKRENGEIVGFSFQSIQPGSIYEKLGFKVGDTITSVNGNPVTSPAQAMEMYNELKSSSNVVIGIRNNNGDESEYNYSITE